MAFNKSGNNWRRRQKDSIEFWMSVEAGRQAAQAYRTLKYSGNRRANELARKLLEKKSSKSFMDNAVKEYDFRKSEYHQAFSDSDSNPEVIY